MDEAKKILDLGAALHSEFLVMAASQTGGRGRHGRVWHSPIGNLYVSFVVRGILPSLLSQFALLWGVILQNCIAGFTDRLVQCKWPNDILIEGKKVSGILIERYKNVLVVGVGINVAHVPEPVQFPATCLNDHVSSPIDLSVLLERICQDYEINRKKWEEAGFEMVRQTWLNAAWRLGDEIIIRQEDRDVVGVFETIDNAGALCIKNASGLTEKLYVGDLIREV